MCTIGARPKVKVHLSTTCHSGFKKPLTDSECVQARTHSTSLCLSRVVCARSVNLIHMLLAASMYSTVTVKAHACTNTHEIMCVCVCMWWLDRGILSVSQDNAGSDSKPLLLYTFCLACSLALLLSLCSICCAGMRHLCPDYVHQNALLHASSLCSSYLCGNMPVYVCDRQQKTARDSWPERREKAQRKCAVIMFFLVLFFFFTLL